MARDYKFNSEPNFYLVDEQVRQCMRDLGYWSEDIIQLIRWDIV